MMTAYILKLIVLVPLVAGLAFGALWLWRKAQGGMSFGQRERAVKLVDALPLGATGRLAVVEFGGKHLLVAVSRVGAHGVGSGRPHRLDDTGPAADQHPLPRPDQGEHRHRGRHDVVGVDLGAERAEPLDVVADGLVGVVGAEPDPAPRGAELRDGVERSGDRPLERQDRRGHRERENLPGHARRG